MKKSLKKQAVFPVLMLLVVTALALIGSSFAWFSMANTATVTEVSGTIEDSSIGLMISQDALNFTSNVTLNENAKTFVYPAKFHQVSSADGVNFFNAEITAKNASNLATRIKTSENTTVLIGTQCFGKYYNDAETPAITNMTISGAQYVLASNGTATTSNTAGASANLASYMVFDLFFQVEAASTLYLNNGTRFTQIDANKAMRVAFIDYAESASNADAATAQAAAVALNTKEGTIIWNPAATADNQVYYGVKKSSVGDGENDADVEFEPYVQNATYCDAVEAKRSSQLFINGTDFTDETQNITNYTPVANLLAGINKLRVVVWLEGNDSTCVTTVARSAVAIALSFYARKVSS